WVPVFVVPVGLLGFAATVVWVGLVVGWVGGDGMGGRGVGAQAARGTEEHRLGPRAGQVGGTTEGVAP
ncbi:MAG: hypothetical protein WD749_02690, partial [Phycisphaerales bacterium]